MLATHDIPKATRVRSDFRHSDDKVWCRAFNLAALDGSLYLTGPGGCLMVDWLELAGVGAPTADLLAPRLGPGHFIGVDLDASVIRDNEALGRPHCRWVHADVEHVLRRPALVNNIGALNLDTLMSWAGADLEAMISEVAPFVLRQFDRLGEFLLIVNAAAWVPRRPRGTEADLKSNLWRCLAPVLSPLDRELRDEDVFAYAARDARTGQMVNVAVKVGYR